MPTQLMSRAEVARRYGVVDRFLPGAADHPIAAGMPAGSVTDDTEQALLIAELLIDDGGRVDAAEFARRLVAWEEGMRERGSLDLLGPSTKAAVSAILRGESVESAGRFGTTNGAAMRVAPVGIARSAARLDTLVDLVQESGRVSHNTGIAIAGAAAVAAAVSAGIEGAGFAEALPVALEAARIGATRGHWIAGGDVGARITWAVANADPSDPRGSLDRLSAVIGTSLATQESVPAAFGVLAIFPDDAWSALCAAATLGGDADTIAAMAGAIAGAQGARFPEDAVATVLRVNHLDLAGVAARLLTLRC
ncbi:ADP-ribosylglycohydrolase family protein [Microbacteriaceae bacterium VKM Ac-2854]|nr:ADP-ribosylglycohydrolase family protein [Microbacteriaceae bacterium VKM Ac-2854]